MPPRKSTTRSQTQQQPHASSSKVTLDHLPVPELPESLTPEYRPDQRRRVRLNEEERGMLVHELIGCSAAEALLEIEEHARRLIYSTVTKNDEYLRALSAGQKKGKALEAMDLEVDTGSYALETMLEQHLDKAFDKFTAWTLRNAFDVPQGLDIVMPWQREMDFDRAEHVNKLPKGEGTILETIEDLRARVEQARLLSYRLALAEKQIDRRLAIARQRKTEVGFVKEVLVSHNLMPLPPKAQQVRSALSALHANLTSLETLPPPENSLPAGTKAWEMGRQAYLNWAVGKMIHPEGKDDTLDVAEEAMEKGGGQEGLDQLSKIVGA